MKAGPNTPGQNAMVKRSNGSSRVKSPARARCDGREQHEQHARAGPGARLRGIGRGRRCPHGPSPRNISATNPALVSRKVAQGLENMDLDLGDIAYVPTTGGRQARPTALVPANEEILQGDRRLPYPPPRIPTQTPPLAPPRWRV